MKNLILTFFALSILLIFSCEKNCSPITFDYLVNDVLTKVNFDFCAEGSTISLVDNKNDKGDFFQFFSSNKNSLFFTSQISELTTRIDTNKSKLFVPNQINTCNNNSKMNLKVDFFTRTTPDNVFIKQKIEQISDQVDKFSLKLNQGLVIDSISINVTSLAKPCVLQLSDNLGGTEARFFIKIDRCGIIEHQGFQLHWSNIKKLYINKNSFKDNLFVGEIKVLFQEDIK
jgi:hypothetical protein